MRLTVQETVRQRKGAEMEFSIIPDKDALGKCAWCQNQINDEMEVYCLGAKLRPDNDLSGYQSHCIEIEQASGRKPICMMVTAKESQARKEGNDGMFMVCSEKCGQELKNGLEKDLELSKLFEKIVIADGF